MFCIQYKATHAAACRIRNVHIVSITNDCIWHARSELRPKPAERYRCNPGTERMHDVQKHILYLLSISCPVHQFDPTLPQLPAFLPGVVDGHLHLFRLLRHEAELWHQVNAVLWRITVTQLSWKGLRSQRLVPWTGTSLTSKAGKKKKPNKRWYNKTPCDALLQESNQRWGGAMLPDVKRRYRDNPTLYSFPITAFP